MKNTILTITLALLIPILAGAQSSSQQTPGEPNKGTTPAPVLRKKTGPKRSTTSAKTNSTATQAKPNMGGTTSGTTTTGGTSTNSKAGNMTGGTGTGTNTNSKAGNMSGGGGTTTTTTSGGTGNVTQSDASSAIKQALINGITKGVNEVSAVNGYFGNPEIKIPLPAQLQPVDNVLRNFGAGQMVDKLVEQLNHSAEQAATQATPIFLSSINQLTITDAINIISNQQQDAATAFLKRTTTEQLVAAFKPKIKLVLDQTKTNEVYGDVMKYYNEIPFVEHVDADLSDYVTRKALDGLFIMIAKEEAKIRQDPKGQVSNIISTVFGTLLHKK